MIDQEKLATSVWDPLTRFVERGGQFLPVLLALVVVLVCGLVAAWLLDAILRRALRLVRFDRLAGRPRVFEALRRAGLWRSPSELVGQLVRWVVVVLTLVAALSILSVEATDTVLQSLVSYLPRLAVLVDNLMHRFGLHGFTVIPMMLGLGCNVPGALAVRVLETRKEKFIAVHASYIAPQANR